MVKSWCKASCMALEEIIGIEQGHGTWERGAVLPLEECCSIIQRQQTFYHKTALGSGKGLLWERQFINWNLNDRLEKQEWITRLFARQSAHSWTLCPLSLCPISYQCFLGGGNYPHASQNPLFALGDRGGWASFPHHIARKDAYRSDGFDSDAHLLLCQVAGHCPSHLLPGGRSRLEEWLHNNRQLEWQHERADQIDHLTLVVTEKSWKPRGARTLSQIFNPFVWNSLGTTHLVRLDQMILGRY